VSFDEITSEQTSSSIGAAFRDLQLMRADEGIQNFFKRPINFFNMSLTVSTGQTEVYPWQGFLENVRVANRLANYKGFRGRLKVKIVTNGNPFYFGRVMVSYYPLFRYQASLVMRDDEYGSNDFGLSVIQSQRQHVNLCPSQSTGMEMELPFVWHRDFMCVASDETDPSAPAIANELGTLIVNPIVPLRTLSTNTGSNPTMVLRFYVWMEDIQLFGLTTKVQATIAPQSNPSALQSEETTEAQSGMVSSTLTTIGNVAHHLSTVPGFKPYALPIEMASNLGAAVAQALGFGRPLNLTEPAGMTPKPFSTLAHATGADNCVKLTLDPNQSVSVDPNICGSGEDEMSFKHICGRYSLYNSFSWSITDMPSDRLFNVPVSAHVTPSFDQVYYPTAVGGVANMFTYWKGSMTYRFDVISNSFHRGRLAVVYDPCTGGSLEENVQYVAIVDIAEARSFEVTVQFNESRGMKTIRPLYTNQGDSVLVSVNREDTNGVIGVFVATSLEIPNYVSTVTPDDVTVLCYVKGGDDLMFVRPQNLDYGVDMPLFIPESNMSALGDQLDSCCDTDTKKVLDIGFKHNIGADATYVGEHIDSLRALCKRYYTYVLDGVDVSLAGESILTYEYGVYPSPWGEQNIHALPHTVTGETNNIVGFTPMAYAQLAFVCKRGATRWKFFPLTPQSSSTSASFNQHGGAVFASRDEGSFAETLLGGHATTSFAKTPYVTGTLLSISAGGAVALNSMNPTLEIEIPYQNPDRFVLARGWDGSTHKPMNTTRELIRFAGHNFAFPKLFALLCAAGEDFTLQHFVGWPPYVLTDT